MPEFLQVLFYATMAALPLLGLYLFSVLRSGSRQKRELARSIHSAGATPREIVTRAWTGSNYRGLDEQLKIWTRAAEALAHYYRHYPMLIYFPARDKKSSLALAIAGLNEAIDILEFFVPEEQRPPPRILRPLRAAIDRLLDSVKDAGVRPGRTVPPPSRVPERLARPAPKLAREYERHTAERRKLLLGWVEDDFRDWPDSF